MSTITLQVIHTIDPAAIEALRSLFIPAASIAPVASAQLPVPAQAIPQDAVQQPVPAPAVSMPQPAPVPVQTPQQPAAPAQPATVPTADRTYTIDELARAGAALMDAGKGAEALAVMQQFGIQRVTDLQPGQYAAFATALRSLGARI